MPKKALNAKVYNTRRRERTKMRWMDNVTDDLRIIQITEWCFKLKDGMLWSSIAEGAKAHPGLFSM